MYQERHTLNPLRQWSRDGDYAIVHGWLVGFFLNDWGDTMWTGVCYVVMINGKE